MFILDLRLKDSEFSLKASSSEFLYDCHTLNNIENTEHYDITYVD